MTVIHPQMMTLMQDLSSWVLSGRCADAAAALGRMSAIRDDFSPWAAGASAVARLPTGLDVRQRGFLQLLTSPELTPVLSQTPQDQIGRLDLAFRIEGDDGLLGAEQSLLRIVDGMFAWDAPALRAVLGGVIEAGGLGDLALAVEKGRGGLSGFHFERGRAALHALTQRFRRVVPSIERQAEKISLLPQLLAGRLLSEGARRFFQADEAANGGFRKDLILLCGLQNFLASEVYASLPQDGQLFLSDLLRQAPDGRPHGLGSCVPKSVLTAHLAEAAGVRLNSLIHNCSHISLSLPGTPLVMDAGFGAPWFRTVEEWRQTGLLGRGQSPGPLRDLLSSYVNSVMGILGTRSGDNDLLRQGFEASSKICPDHFGVLVNRAHMEKERYADMQVFIGRLSRLDPSSPWISYLEAYGYRALGRNADAISTFERTFRSCAGDGIKILDGRPVPIILADHLEPAIQDYVRLGLEEGEHQRVRSTLQNLRYHPDPRIQTQAVLFLMLLSGGAGQA